MRSRCRGRRSDDGERKGKEMECRAKTFRNMWRIHQENGSFQCLTLISPKKWTQIQQTSVETGSYTHLICVTIKCLMAVWRKVRPRAKPQHTTATSKHNLKSSTMSTTCHCSKCTAPVCSWTKARVTQTGRHFSSPPPCRESTPRLPLQKAACNQRQLPKQSWRCEIKI